MVFHRIVAALFLALLLASTAGAEEGGGESTEPGPRVIQPPGSKPKEGWRKARDRWIEEKIGDRKARMEERIGSRKDREERFKDLLRDRREVFLPRVRGCVDFSLLFPGGSLVKGTPLGRGMRLDYGSDLGIQGTAVMPRVEVTVDLSPKAGGGLDVSYHYLSGRDSVGAPLLYHGTLFPSGERLESHLDNLLAGGWIHYRFYDTPKATLWARAGARYLNQIAVLRGSSGRRTVEGLDAFVPFVGALADFPLGSRSWFLADVKLGFLWFGEDKYWQRNSLVELHFGLAFHLFHGGRLVLGYLYLHLASLREDRGAEEETQLSHHGLTTSLRIRF
ncbi:MAG: hypothetical protein ACYS47_14715 [Planctomycetota bacterium]|jgi:hypothetical protein